MGLCSFASDVRGAQSTLVNHSQTLTALCLHSLKMRLVLTAAGLFGFAQYADAQAMMRFGCSQLVIERVDPLVNPGQVYTPHVHQIVGGNSFNVSMDPEVHDPAALSTCTTCTYSEDMSNYWTAVLYYKARNGTFKRVAQEANMGLVQNGGITVYYIPPYDGRTKVTAFPKVTLHSPVPNTSGYVRCEY